MAFSVRQSLVWMTLSQGGQFTMSFGMSLVIARLLSPYEMGVFAIAVAIVGLLSTLRSLGLPSYIVRATELSPEVLAAAFTINAALSIVVSIVIVGLSALGGALLNEPGVQRLLLVMAISPLLSILEFLPAAGIERQGDFRVIATVNLLRTFVSNIVVIGCALMGASYMSLAYGQIISVFVGVVCVNAIGWRYSSVRLGLVGWRDLTRYGLHMLAISGIGILSSKTADLLLGRILGLEALGLYSRASGLSGMIWENLHIVITRIVFVDFAEQRRQGISLRQGYLRIVRVVTALLWPAFVGLAVIAGPLVVVFYGERWEGAAAPLSLLALASAILVSITMTWEVFVVCQETGRQARFEFVRAGVGLLLFAGGCFFSLTGVATAKVAEALFSLGLYRPHLERMTDTEWRDFRPIYLESAFLTLLAVLPAAIAMSFHGWAPTTPFPIVLVTVTLGAMLWLVGLRLIQHPLYAEGQRLVARIRPKQAPSRVEP